LPLLLPPLLLLLLHVLLQLQAAWLQLLPSLQLQLLLSLLRQHTQRAAVNSVEVVGAVVKEEHRRAWASHVETSRNARLCARWEAVQTHAVRVSPAGARRGAARRKARRQVRKKQAWTANARGAGEKRDGANAPRRSR
jgi:uncharacterized protein with WD repeat